MAYPGKGQLGYRTVMEGTQPDGSAQYLGLVGSANDLDNAAGVLIYGTSKFDADAQSFDFDAYTASADWWRDGYGTTYDTTPIQQSIRGDFTGMKGKNVTMFTIEASNAAGDSYTFVDYDFGKKFLRYMSETDRNFWNDLEANDDDFLSGATLDLDYDVASGPYANTWAVGIYGGQINEYGDSVPVRYSLYWNFE